MITALRIKHFKAHKDSVLSLSNLTLLCGQNGVGKSSVLQSLLLLRQTHQKKILSNGLDLNNPLCYIGKAKDALYQYAEDEHITFVLQNESGEFSWIFDSKISGSTFLDLSSDIDNMAGFEDIALFSNDFQYVSAARLVSKMGSSDDYAVKYLKQISLEKGQCELTLHFLHENQSNDINLALKHTDTEHLDLLTQTAKWESEISKGVNIHLYEIGNSYEVKFSFDMQNGDRTDEFSSDNVGFGLSYVLPVIVAILSAPKGSLLLIENPEAHLHPYGQAKLAELMCLAAEAGIQIIVETHSDHIINGCLVACKKEQIKVENIKIIYFDRDEIQHAAKAIEVPILKGGKIKKPPKGFFDQIGKDLRTLMS